MMIELEEYQIESNAKLLEHNNFSGARDTIKIIIDSINKDNFYNKMKVIEEAITLGRMNRPILIDTRSNGEKLVDMLTKNESEKPQDLIIADNEAMLIVFIAQSIFEQLELDNLALNSKEEINGLVNYLDNFVSEYITGNWYYSDSTNWRERKL